MIEQISMFEGDKPLKLHNPVRLIELFGGIGAQAKALENLGVDFETYFLCEFDPYPVKGYNAIHHTNFGTSDVTKITAKDLNIVDTDKYDYILTYSFPCQDISLAGKRAGYSKGEDTRSGLLWEVERLLTECRELMDEDKRYGLPQVLLMENVPQVHSEGENMENFWNWLCFLESIGYSNKWHDLNAKDYGIPQNRNRCFCISFLGPYYYSFPEGAKLKWRLKDVLDEDVEEKFYLSDEAVDGLIRQIEQRA